MKTSPVLLCTIVLLLVYLILRYLSLLSACDQYNGMTKHNNAGMQNNLEPSQSLTQNNCSALYNEPTISINYNTMINMNNARTKVKIKPIILC